MKIIHNDSDKFCEQRYALLVVYTIHAISYFKKSKIMTDHSRNDPEATTSVLYCWDSLPDKILVDIGLSVAKVCGLRDFVFFSMASKRLHTLLMNSEATVSEVIRFRTSFMSRSLSTTTPKATQTMKTMSITSTGSTIRKEPLVPPYSPSLPADLRNLRELKLFECFYGSFIKRRNVLNYPHAPHFHLPPDGDRHSRHARWHAQKEVVLAIARDVVRAVPSAAWVLESHCAAVTNNPTGDDDRDSNVTLRHSILHTLQFATQLEIPTDNTSISIKGRRLGRKAPDPDHFLVIQLEPSFWLELYVTLERDSSPPFELPLPREDRSQTGLAQLIRELETW